MHSTLGVEAAAGQQGFMHLFVEFAKPFRMPDFFLISGLFLARVIDRARIVEDRIGRARGEEHDRLVLEIRTLDQRIKIVNNCISLTVLSACLVCMVVTLLFANQLFSGRLDTPIALMFVGAMLSVGTAFALFIVETRIGSSVVRVRTEILFHKEEGKE